MATNYEDNVFINCPFDVAYLPLFHAIVFAIHDCGFISRSALEVSNATEIRLSKILRIIAESKYGIHDISRTELNDNNLPRFNMPLELGLFLSCQAFGSGKHKKKNCLILDREPYRYQQFISDIAGQDIYSHNDDPLQAILHVRNWLNTVSARRPIPDGSEIGRRFERFRQDLPPVCARLHLDPALLEFVDYQYIVADWLRYNTWP